MTQALLAKRGVGLSKGVNTPHHCSSLAANNRSTCNTSRWCATKVWATTRAATELARLNMHPVINACHIPIII